MKVFHHLLKRGIILSIIFTIIISILLIIEIYLGMNKYESKNLKQFDKKWLVNIELSNPKLASNMRKYIREGNWDKMEACLRNALLWGCSGEKTNNDSYIIKYENLNKL
jgi:hypothetical protein